MYIWYALLFHLPSIRMDTCKFAFAMVVAAPILKLCVLYWVLSKHSLDNKVFRMLLNSWVGQTVPILEYKQWVIVTIGSQG